MYHTTPTGVIIAGATITPAIGSVVEGAAGPATPEVLAGPGVDGAAVVDATEVLGVKIVNDDVAAEIIEVLGVKISRGDNPLVDAIHGAANGTLPFTGYNILFLVLSAITLILMGLAVVRIGRNIAGARATA